MDEHFYRNSTLVLYITERRRIASALLLWDQQKSFIFLLEKTERVHAFKEARNSFHFPQTSFTNSFPITVWFIVSV